MSEPNPAMESQPEARWQRVDRITWFQRQRLAQARAIVVGLGALGQPLATHLALNDFGSILLIDRDTIAAHNLPRSPLFRDSDVGGSKAVIAAQRLAAINPGCRIAALHADVEHVGAGVFRWLRLGPGPGIAFGAADNRRARMIISQQCWHWGPTTFIDGGIDGETMTGVAKVFVPGPDAACYECGMSASAYQEAYRPAPCDAAGADGPPTLSTIAASVAATMATEAIKLLSGMSHRGAGGTELYFDGMANHLLASALTPNSSCLFDHVIVPEQAVLELPQGPGELTVAELFRMAAEHLGAGTRLDFGADIALATGDSDIADRPFASPCGVHVIGEAEVARCGEATLAQLGVAVAGIIAARNSRGDERYFQIGSAAPLWGEPLTPATSEAK